MGGAGGFHDPFEVFREVLAQVGAEQESLEIS